MKRKLFYNHLISRLFAPLPLGMLIYMLVLLVFDNLGSLGEVFFEKEALLCIGITYLVAELLRAIANGFVPRISCRVAGDPACGVRQHQRLLCVGNRL